MSKTTDTSKYMALLLRHKPEQGRIVLDEQGYTDVRKLLDVLKITKKELDEIVRTDNKRRYSYNEDGTMIRANQGHSVKNVHIDFKEFVPEGKIYHGTAMKYFDGISTQGLKPQTRQYVHLSKDYETAINVGMRHAKTEENLLIYEIDVEKMLESGHKFYISDNGVVLTDAVPVQCLKIIRGPKERSEDLER